jgi:hypothetical protein
VATAGAFAIVLPLLLRTGLRTSGAELSDLLRRAMLPAYAAGALLAAALAGIRFGLEPDTLPAVAAVAIAAVLGYWAAYYALVLEPPERELVRGLLRR